MALTVIFVILLATGNALEHWRQLMVCLYLTKVSGINQGTADRPVLISGEKIIGRILIRQDVFTFSKMRLRIVSMVLYMSHEFD